MAVQRWEQGRAVVDRLVDEGRIEIVHPSREHAERLLEQANRHVGSATAIARDDPEGAYSTLYDAARKALWAILANQGLRPTRAGGHLAVYEAVRAQLDPPLGADLRPFDRMRRQRNGVEYPDTDRAPLDEQDVLDDIPKVRVMLDIASRVVEQMPVY